MTKTPPVLPAGEPAFGVYFFGDRKAVSFAASWRIDLQIGRMALHANWVAELARVKAQMDNPSDRTIEPDVLGVIVTQTETQATKLVLVLHRFWAARGRVTQHHIHGPRRMNAADVALTLSLCSRVFGFKHYSIDGMPNLKRASRPGAGALDVIERHWVEDPMVTDAEYYHRAALQPKNANVAMVEVDVNLTSLIGGMARMREAARDTAHSHAAKLLRGLHDRAQLGGPRAIDPSAVKVDRSGPSAGLVADIGRDAREKYQAAQDALGERKFRLVEKFVIHDMSISSLARVRFGSDGGWARARISEEIKLAMDDLAHHFSLVNKPNHQSRPAFADPNPSDRFCTSQIWKCGSQDHTGRGFVRGGIKQLIAMG